MAEPIAPPLSHYLKEEVAVCVSCRDGRVFVDPDRVEVWRDKKERVHWFACGEVTIEAIVFGPRPGEIQDPPSPFEGAIEFHPKKKHGLSGKVLGSIPDNSKPFKYTVTVRYHGNLLPPFDPEVNVMP
jgi:hypothetical protein